MIAEKRELFFSFLAKVNSASQTCGWPTNEDATLQVKRSAVVQHLCSFLWLINSTGSLTTAVGCEERWKLICSQAASLSTTPQVSWGQP
jgi:hypothetical protein